MSYLSIGSGDVAPLLSGKKTKGYANLWRKFLDEFPPRYNAYASPIDALRTGAILEDVYAKGVGDNCYVQVKATCEDLDVFTSSIDFAFLEKGKIVDFEELKTIFLTDYLGVIKSIEDLDEKGRISAIKSKFRNNYNQVQFQLKCSKLDSALISFLSVDSYVDEVNRARIIRPEEVTKFRIPRDEEVIGRLTERGQIFQAVKDDFRA